ncbi:Atrial natriuretic peptide receptor 2 [Holothuria leucospilota]|uniref:guanylate cyclase n=1 Tax=Holothuria leucospilota TaxID=206669 RepID=A0A9Q1C0W9_HOLLE|nr:Atrial natriuretic peptide receptor 2 [Holothuria leucospilota]
MAKQLLLEVSKKARVIIVTLRGEQVREVMIAAHKLGLINGEYVFISIELFPDFDYFGNQEWKQGDEYDEIAKEAYEALMTIGLFEPKTKEYFDFQDELRSREMQIYNRTRRFPTDRNFFTSAFYDAVILYSLAVNETLAEGGDIRDGSQSTAFSFLCRRMSLNAELMKMSWMIKWDDLVFEKQKRSTFSRSMSMGRLVLVAKLKKDKIDLNRDVLVELRNMRQLDHTNLVRFMGACVEQPNIAIVQEFCTKGNLEGILHNDDIKLDWTFKYSLINDVIQGLHYIHGSNIAIHGYLTSETCFVDSRFVLKLGFHGLHLFRKDEKIDQTDSKQMYKILSKVKDEKHPPFRQVISDTEVNPNIIHLINKCVDERPEFRPNPASMMVHMRRINKNIKGGSNLLDNLLARMEQYANNLEKLVEERTAAFLEEKKKAETLLYEVLPKSVADQLKHGQSVKPEYYEAVTIFFSDIVGFTSMSAQSTPMQVVAFLNDLYTCFDGILVSFDVYKVETIGDAYMVVSGLPIRNGDKHAREIANMSLVLIDACSNFKIRHFPDHKLLLRVGIHTGRYFTFLCFSL